MFHFFQWGKLLETWLHGWMTACRLPLQNLGLPFKLNTLPVSGIGHTPWRNILHLVVAIENVIWLTPKISPTVLPLLVVTVSWPYFQRWLLNLSFAPGFLMVFLNLLDLKAKSLCFGRHAWAFACRSGEPDSTTLWSWISTWCLLDGEGFCQWFWTLSACYCSLAGTRCRPVHEHFAKNSQEWVRKNLVIVQRWISVSGFYFLFLVILI